MAEIQTVGRMAESETVGRMAESETVGRMAEKSNTETACEMCMKDDARYKCPACSARTCSLECVRGHKSRKQCDGVRKHEFVPVSEFTDTHMHQDISFLSRVKDVAFSSSRTFAKAPYPSPKRGGLRKALRKAYEWKELPEGMSRRNENQTHIKNACIFWTVKLHIHAPLMLSDKIIMLHAKSENDTIESLLPEELLALGKPFGVFLKKEGSQTRTFYKLQRSESLKEALQGKLIIEYPLLELFLE